MIFQDHKKKNFIIQSSTIMMKNNIKKFCNKSNPKKLNKMKEMNKKK